MFGILWNEFKQILTEFIDNRPDAVTDKQELITFKPETSNTLPIPQAGIELIKDIETLRLVGYPDQGGIPTDGYGNTHGAKIGVVITEEKANADLEKNCAAAWACILKNVKVPLTENQYGALLSFTLNDGGTAFANSTLLKKINAHDMAGGIAEFKKWVYVKVNGKYVVSNGLVDRRHKEIIMFCGGDWRIS